MTSPSNSSRSRRPGWGGLAEEILLRGRRQIPEQSCLFSANLGVVLYLSGKREQALKALQSVPDLAVSDPSTACRLGLFHLGNLQRELGDEEEAQRAHKLFLNLTPFSRDPRILQARTQILGRGGRVGEP